MTPLLVCRRIEIPMIGTWKWTKADYEVPLVFHLNGVKAGLTLDCLAVGKRDRVAVWEADLVLEFTNPSPDFVRGLKTSSKLSIAAAETIYRHYLQIHEQFEGVLRTAGSVRNLQPSRVMSLKEFFQSNPLNDHACEWFLDGDERPKQFKPKLSNSRRTLNPLFRSDQIVTREKWKRLQLALDNHDFPAPELLELLRIRARLQWPEKKIPTIEPILRDYAEQALLACGFSKNRIKSLRDELTFNTFLNVVLPLSLTKGEATRLEEPIRRVDVLRKTRNDIVHGNIRPDDIDENSVRSGIEGALEVVAFIRRKLQ